MAASSFAAFAQVAPKSKVGLISTMETLAQISEKKFQSIADEAARNPKAASQLFDYDSVALAPEFVEALLFYSDRSTLALAQKDECAFYALLEHGSFEIQGKAPQNVIARITSQKKGTETLPFPLASFMNEVYKTKCFNNKDLNKLFELDNLKGTLNSVKFPVPQNEQECLDQLINWKNNPYTPHLCSIEKRASKLEDPAAKKKLSSEEFKNAQALIGKISSFQLTYLQNLCQSFENPRTFCDKYLKKGQWQKVINGQASLDQLEYLCKIQLGKLDTATLRKEELIQCLGVFSDNPEKCQTLGTANFPSLFPRPSCEAIQDALETSRLNVDYQDCPGLTNNEAVSNSFRISEHFLPQKSNQGLTPGRECADRSADFFLRMNIDADNEAAWSYNYCYQDPVRQKEVCKVTLLGPSPQSPYSLTHVFEEILTKVRPSLDKIRCEFVSETVFNPSRLQYKNNCFVLYKPDRCSSTFCPNRVIFNEKDITNMVRLKGGSTIDYFPLSYSRTQYALSTVMENKLKLKSQNIRNLSELKAFFKISPVNIIHGVGCAEELYPEAFTSVSLNSCTSLPFIIDGFRDIDSKTFLTIRTSIDDIHSPRILLWNYVYNAVKTYERFHPLNTWALYGIKK